MLTAILRCKDWNGKKGMCPYNAIDCHKPRDRACYWQIDDLTGDWF